MNNIKKIGMTALAASLASTSAFAGAVSVSGGASINYGVYSGTQLNTASSWTMGDNLKFSGTGTLENGLSVTLAMEIDQGKAPSANSPYEAQSVTVARDDLGTLVFAGRDGDSAGSSVSKTAAGNIWDSFDGSIGGRSAGVARLNGDALTNSFFYTSPALIEGLNLFASYQPHEGETEGYIGYGVTYAGVAGLTANVAQQDVEGGVASNLDGEQTVIKIAYAVGPITVTASDNDYETGNGSASSVAAGANVGQKTRSYALAYTLSEALSVNIGTETIDAPLGTDAEFTTIGASYTMGGMTLSAKRQTGDNTDHTTTAANDQEFFTTGISFAF